jgi:hypothetical protein
MVWFTSRIRTQTVDLSRQEIESLGFLLIEFRSDGDWPVLGAFQDDVFQTMRVRLNGRKVAKIFNGRYFVVPCRPGRYKVHCTDAPFFFSYRRNVDVRRGEYTRIVVEHISYPLLATIPLGFIKPHWISGLVLPAMLHPIWLVDFLIWWIVPRWFKWKQIWLTSHRLWQEEQAPMTNEIADMHLQPAPLCRNSRNFDLPWGWS